MLAVAVIALPLVLILIAIRIFLRYKAVKNNGIIVKGRVVEYRWISWMRFTKKIDMIIEYKIGDIVNTANCSIISGNLPYKNDEKDFYCLPNRVPTLRSIKLGENVDYAATCILLGVSILFFVTCALPICIVVFT